MSVKDPTAGERVKRHRTKQQAAQMKECRVWVDNDEFEYGYRSFHPEIHCTVDLNTLADAAGFVLGWRKAYNEWRRTNGIPAMTQKQLDVEVARIQKMSEVVMQIELSLNGELKINGPVTPLQLHALTKLSKRVQRMHAQQNTED